MAIHAKESYLFRELAPMSLLSLIVILGIAMFGGMSRTESGCVLIGLIMGLSLGWWRCTSMYVNAQSDTQVWIPDPELGFAGNETEGLHKYYDKQLEEQRSRYEKELTDLRKELCQYDERYKCWFE